MYRLRTPFQTPDKTPSQPSTRSFPRPPAARRADVREPMVDPAAAQYLNIHLPVARGQIVNEGLTQNQLDSLGEQAAILDANWEDLQGICREEYAELGEQDDEKPFMKHVRDRIPYGGGASLKETDTVLFDLYFYMVQKNLEYTATFRYLRRMLREARDRRNSPETKARRIEKDAYFFQFWKW